MEKVSEKGAGPELSCPICQSLTVSKCGACSKVAYCSKEHQKAHWKVHRAECQAWRVAEVPALGRVLLAARDIKAGELILREAPLLLAPPKVTPPVCPGCYIEFEDDAEGPSQPDYESKYAKPEPCPRGCGWPTCGAAECIDSASHEAECGAGVSRGGLTIRNYGRDHPSYEALGVLRILGLQRTDPKGFRNLMSLKGQDGEAKLLLHDPKELVEERKKTNARAVSLIKDFFKCPDVSKEDVLQMLAIIETNGHDIPIPDVSGQINRRVIGVYYTSSFLEHNCRPNCVKTWESGSKALILRASVPIKKGDHLSISYVDPMWGTADRLNFLEMSKLFTCRCQRCTDPSELGTHLSSIRCRQVSCTNQLNEYNLGKIGLVAPTDPFDMEQEWKCGTCAETYPAGTVSSIVEKVGRDLEALHEKYGDLEAEEEFLRKFGKVLGPNHFYLLEIKLGLAQLYGRVGEELFHLLPPKKLLRKRQLCEELLTVFNVLVPGYNRLRALILYELQASVGALSKLGRTIGEISRETHKEELLQCVKWMGEVIRVLSWEPENSIERRRGNGAVAELEDLRSLLTSDLL